MTALQQQRKSIDSVSRKLWLAIISDMKGFVVSTFVSFFFPFAQTVRDRITQRCQIFHTYKAQDFQPINKREI